MLQNGSPSVLTISVECSGNLQTPGWDVSSLAEDVKITQKAEGSPEALLMLLLEQRGHAALWAAARLLAPSLLPLLQVPNRARPAPSFCCLSSSRRLRTPTGRAREGKQPRLSSGLDLTEPGPGAGLPLQRTAPATPSRPGTLRHRLSEGGAGRFPLSLPFTGACRGWGGAPA